MQTYNDSLTTYALGLYIATEKLDDEYMDAGCYCEFCVTCFVEFLHQQVFAISGCLDADL